MGVPFRSPFHSVAWAGIEEMSGIVPDALELTAYGGGGDDLRSEVEHLVFAGGWGRGVTAI